MKDLKPVSTELLYTRNDPADPRLGELVSTSAPSSPGVAILGYPDHEGIQLNGGRLGAAEGPNEIRRWLYRMTPHPRRNLKKIFDNGNLQPDQGALKERHEWGRAHVLKRLKDGLQVLAFGGGNDYAYCDGAAFLEFYGDKKPLIINVDAHFDVRNTSRGLSSGTPFFRLMEMGKKFDFVELGAQSSCNSKAHWDYVEQQGGKILSAEEQLLSGETWTKFAVSRLGPWLVQKRPTYLAIDIDAFSWPFAAGASASWPFGILPHDFFPLYQHLIKLLDVRVLGIYETSPALENGHGTAKLAAQLAHMYMHEF